MSLNSRYGPWAVVTGASSGIGRALAGELAGAGISLVLVARRKSVLEALASSLRAEHGVEVEVVVVDLSRPDSRAALEAATQGLTVGMVVHSAGFGLGGAHLEDALDAHRQMLDVNCRGALDVVDLYLPAMQERGHGAVVLLGSAIGFSGVPWAAHYAATKAWVITFAEGLAIEAAQHGVDVMAIAPGPTDTAFFEHASMTASATSSPQQVARVALRRLGRQRVVVPDWLGWLISWSLATVPRWMRVRIMATVMRGMTAPA